MRIMYDHGHYQCLLLESEDMDDPIGSELAFGAHFLDFPYAVSEGTKNSVEEILRAKIENEDEAHFVLWDKEQLEVVGRGHLEDLLLEQHDRPEIGFIYIKQDRRGGHLVDSMYKGIFQYLDENDYGDVRAKIDNINEASFKAAARNGFQIYNPPDMADSAKQNTRHVTRPVPTTKAPSVELHDQAERHI